MKKIIQMFSGAFMFFLIFPDFDFFLLTYTYKHMINLLRFILKLCNKNFKFRFLKKQMDQKKNNLISECYCNE
jgi:hypothetical protein